MTSKPITTSKTVKLKNIVPDLIVTPLANKIANKTQVTSHTVQVSKAEVIKKLEFMNRVVARTEVKKREAKPTIEAALAVLVEALINGDELHIPPLGKLWVVKSKDIDSGAKVLTLKLRTMKEGAGLGAIFTEHNIG